MRVVYPILTHTPIDLKKQLYNSLDQVGQFADLNLEKEMLRIKYNTSKSNTFIHMHHKINTKRKFSLQKHFYSNNNNKEAVINQRKINDINNKTNDNTIIIHKEPNNLSKTINQLYKNKSNTSLSILTNNKDSRRSTIKNNSNYKENMNLYRTIFNNTNTKKVKKPKILSIDSHNDNNKDCNSMSSIKKANKLRKITSSYAGFVLSTQYELKGIKKKTSFLGNILNYVYPIILKTKIEPLLTEEFKKKYELNDKKINKSSQVSSHSRLLTHGPILPMENKRHANYISSNSFNLSQQKHFYIVKSPQSKLFSPEKLNSMTKYTFHTNELTLEL